MKPDHLRLAAEDERDPMRELHDLLRRDSPAASRLRMSSELTWEPPTDVVETADEIVVSVDIAGMEGKEISVVTDGAVLRVRGTRRGAAAPGVKHFHQIEIRSGPFERAIVLPSSRRSREGVGAVHEGPARGAHTQARPVGVRQAREDRLKKRRRGAFSTWVAKSTR